jgi:hypothetical protein
MKRVLLLFVIGFVLLPAYCRAADDSYGYPIPDPFDATIMGTPEPLKAQIPAVVPTRQLVLAPSRGSKNRIFSFTMMDCTAPWPTRKRRLPLSS